MCAQCGLVFGVDLYEGTCDGKTEGFSLSFVAATVEVDLDVVLFNAVEGEHWLLHDVLQDGRGEVYVDRTLVDGDCAVAFLYDYAGYGGLAAAYCINCFHARLFQCVDVDNFGVLCLVGMIRAVVDVHVRDDAASEAVFRKHALHHMDVQGVVSGLEVLVE